jgi:hypothetical protein
LHGMAYYIFLKSLRSLEEFRKNPHAKIPPKSPSTISQSPAIIKNQILFGKEFSFAFGPIGLVARPASQPSQPPAPSPFLPQAACARSAHPGLRGIGVFAKRRLLFKFAQPGDDAFSLCHRQAGPTISSIFHLAPADPGHAAASLGHPAPPSLYLEMPSQGVNSPALIPRVNPLLNHPRPSMALMP